VSPDDPHDPVGPADELTVTAVDGFPEVAEGDDLAALLVRHAGAALRDGDVLVVTSKVVSKAEGRTRRAAKEELLAAETDRVVARRGPTTVVRTRQGLVLAGAGIDASNTPGGTSVLLPEEPDASARRLREAVHGLTGRNVAVVVSDTAGRAWRTGQTDIAVGAAGLVPQVDLAGRVDAHGNPLSVTAPPAADEGAAAGDLVTGQPAGRPVAHVRGLAHLVLPAGEHGPGAAALVRPEGQDMFGLGARDAVLLAVTAGPGTTPRGFGAPVPAEEAARLLRSVTPAAPEVRGDEVAVPLPPLGECALGRWEARLTAAAVALGWVPVDTGTAPADGRLRFRSTLS
jgi:coenzyme F420-0:L-glutamate ligase/coenzyme F420-1:gamma-L-glutamate ligase